MSVWPSDEEIKVFMSEFGGRLRARDRAVRLADAVHEALGWEVGCCVSHLDASTTAVTHDLSREWWFSAAADLGLYLRARLKEEWPESIANTLRSHSFPHCEACGAAIDDPEATTYCESEWEKKAGPAPEGTATDIAGLGPDPSIIAHAPTLPPFQDHPSTR